MAGLTRILSTSTVRPRSGDRHSDFNRRIDLTPSDLQCLRGSYMNIGLLFNKPNEIPVEHLKATLSEALDRLYPLAGRLVATEHDGDIITTSFHIECSGAGVKFVHAEAVGSITVADILDPLAVPTEIIGCLFPMNGFSSHQAAGSDLPLLAVQVTEVTGGVFVAVSRNHGVADGTTFWDFFNVWSELSRGDSAAISQRGGFVFGRECFHGHVDFPVRIASHHSKGPPRVVPRVLPHQSVLRFSKDKIGALKAKVNAACAGREISSLQALMAHLWVCITRSRALRDDDTVSFTTAVGMRSRLRPPLPQSYVGNAIALTVVTCVAGELLGRGTGWAALQINQAFAAHASKEPREFFDYCAERLLAKVQPNMLMFGGSPWFDVYGNDFGWGRPLTQRTGLVGAVSGFLYIYPGASQGSVEFDASLTPETFRALAGDPEFTEYTS